MRQPAIRKPKVFIEPNRIDYERVALPLAGSAAIVERIVVIAGNQTRRAILPHIDDPVIVVAAAHQEENSLASPVLHELHSEARFILTRTAGRLAIEVHR